MMRKQVSNLTGAELDYAVALVLKEDYTYLRSREACRGTKNYSTDWAQGGPIIGRERISIKAQQPDWTAYIAICDGMTDRILRGPTPLIAAMRCFVASKLGDEVKIPEHVVQTT